MTLDLHAGQIQGFFDIPTDNLFAAPVMVRDIQEHYDSPSWWSSRPTSAAWCARAASPSASTCRSPSATSGASAPANPRSCSVIGDVKGKRCILIDDIVDSGGTLVNAANALLEQGATEVAAYITHGVLSNGAVAKITKLEAQDPGDHRLDPADRAVKTAKNIRVLSIAPLLGEAIARTAREESVSSLFY